MDLKKMKMNSSFSEFDYATEIETAIATEIVTETVTGTASETASEHGHGDVHGQDSTCPTSRQQAHPAGGRICCLHEDACCVSLGSGCEIGSLWKGCRTNCGPTADAAVGTDSWVTMSRACGGLAAARDFLTTTPDESATSSGVWTGQCALQMEWGTS